MMMEQDSSVTPSSASPESWVVWQTHCLIPRLVLDDAETFTAEAVSGTSLISLKASSSSKYCEDSGDKIECNKYANDLFGLYAVLTTMPPPGTLLEPM